jgi:hypothetical protein
MIYRNSNPGPASKARSRSAVPHARRSPIITMKNTYLLLILALMSIPLHADELQYRVKSLPQELKNVDHTSMKKWIKTHKPELYDSFYKDQVEGKKKRYNTAQEMAFLEFYLSNQARKGWRFVSVNSLGIMVFEINAKK